MYQWKKEKKHNQIYMLHLHLFQLEEMYLLKSDIFNYESKKN